MVSNIKESVLLFILAFFTWMMFTNAWASWGDWELVNWLDSNDGRQQIWTYYVNPNYADIHLSVAVDLDLNGFPLNGCSIDMLEHMTYDGASASYMGQAVKWYYYGFRGSQRGSRWRRTRTSYDPPGQTTTVEVEYWEVPLRVVMLLRRAWHNAHY